jgi:signal transduction histidine kinase
VKATTALACRVRRGASTPPARVFPRRKPQVDALGAGRLRWEHPGVIEGQTASRLAWSLAGLVVLILLAAFVFLILGLGTPLPESAFGFKGWGLILGSAFAIAGVLIASRVPSNPIGWVLLAAAVGTAVQEFGQHYSQYGLYHAPGAVPGADIAAWVTEWVWIPYMASVALLIPMIYPAGRLLSRRWGYLLVLGLTGATLGALCFALAPGDLASFPGVPNPFGIDGAGWIRPFGDLVMLAFVLGVLGAIVSLAIRYRRSRGEERQQLKWLVLALSLLTSSFIIGVPYWTLGGEGTSLDVVATVTENVLVVALISIPVAIGVAILKYRLYAIDVVIKKTVVYAILAVLLFALGVIPAWVIAGLVFAGAGEGGYAFLAAGIVVGLAVWPLRRVATRIADRLVFGRRATPYQVLSKFSGRVAETYAADDVLDRMAQVLGEGVGADAATVWLRVGDRFRPGATWPADHAVDGPIPASAVEVRHQGEVLGALSVLLPASDPITPTKEQLIRDLAGQAGLVLRNATLIEDLKASRQRLVAAQNEERRRIERNIHDGAQQQLVALAVKLKLADSLVGKDEERAHAMLADLQTDTGQALEDLRDLARGIYPPLLADKGLGAALESQARKSAVPVAVETDGIGRYPQEAEAAVYFSCLEALQNVAKYADASHATVRLAQANGILSFEVVDDGRGFDPAAASRGSGLQGIADRLAALGGKMEIRSASGDGTIVAGSLPVTFAQDPT